MQNLNAVSYSVRYVGYTNLILATTLQDVRLELTKEEVSMLQGV
jgi:hypothetical protein